MRIGALSAATGVAARTLRFWEAEGLLPDPGRTPSGYRDYPREAADRVAFIGRAQAAGLTLVRIRTVLAVRDGGEAPCTHVAAYVDERLSEVDVRLEELARTREQLVALRTRLEGLDPTDCAPERVCAAVEEASTG